MVGTLETYDIGKLSMAFFTGYCVLFMLIRLFGPTPMKKHKDGWIKMPKIDADLHQLEVILITFSYFS